MLPKETVALLCDRDDLTGEFRRVESDRGKPLAGKSTLNRLERTPLEGPEGAYKKIVADPAGMDELLLEVFVEAHPEPPEEVILDVDATDDPLHGKQEGSTAITNATATCHCTVRLTSVWHVISRRGSRPRNICSTTRRMLRTLRVSSGSDT